jgi:hypothetical protein
VKVGTEGGGGVDSNTYIKLNTVIMLLMIYCKVHYDRKQQHRNTEVDWLELGVFNDCTALLFFYLLYLRLDGVCTGLV